MEKLPVRGGHLVSLAFALLCALGGCRDEADTVGSMSVELRKNMGGNGYRLRSGTFSIRPAGGSQIVASLLTETNPDAASLLQRLAPGNYTINLDPGWRLEKVDGSGTITPNLSAQLVSSNPASVTINAGQVTNVAFAFFTDAGTVVLGDGDLSVAIDVVDQALLPPATQIATGFNHSCALFAAGNVRCWGYNFAGQLGYANTASIGDNELPAAAGDVDLGGTVTQIAAGAAHTCALLSGGNVRCWGLGSSGQLGYSNTNSIGDNEIPAAAGDVNVGGTVTQIAAGGSHTCALLSTGAVRCWGANTSGQLGYGNTTAIGDNEAPAAAGNVNVGGTVTQITAGALHTCALLSTGAVRCWGGNGSGELGYGNTAVIGDNEPPALAGDVNIGVGVTALQVSAGGFHTCVLTSNAAVRCWGHGSDGELGLGNTNNIGDNEVPGSVGVALSGGLNGDFIPAQVVTGERHVCARSNPASTTAPRQVRCWGQNDVGQLGLNHGLNVGDNELITAFPVLSLGNGEPGAVAQLAAGGDHTCAIMISGAVRCWGAGVEGQLGYGNTNNIGDNEHPGQAGAVVVTTTPPPASTFPLTVTVTGPGRVNGTPAGTIVDCAPIGTGVCSASFAPGQMVTLTATPVGTATFSGWSGDCTGTAAAVMLTMSQARACTATFMAAPSSGPAPTFVGAGAGVAASLTAGLSVPFPTGVAPGQLLVLQVSSREAVVPTTPAGWSMTFFDEFSNPRQRIYTKTATSTDTGTLAVTIPASNVNAARMYAFSGVRATLPFLEGVATASDADGSLNGPTVTTTGANRLAVAFISLDTNQPMAPFTGELGGDWTEPVAEFLTDAGSNFGIQIQTATLATAGTLSGGQASFGNGPDASICRAFALIGN